MERSFKGTVVQQTQRLMTSCGWQHEDALPLVPHITQAAAGLLPRGPRKHCLLDRRLAEGYTWALAGEIYQGETGHLLWYKRSCKR